MKEHTSFLSLVFGCLILAAGPVFASPVDIVNTFGPGNSFQTSPGSAYNVTGGNNANSTRAPAVQFIPSISAYLSTILVAIGEGSKGRASGFDISLLTDASGEPGTVLESWNGLVPTYGTNEGGSPVTVADALHILLQAGTPYWLLVSPAVTGHHGTLDIWNYNNQGTDLYVTNGGVGAQGQVHLGTAPAFGITGVMSQPDPPAPPAASGTPEPASLMMTGIGSVLLGLAAFLRRLRK